MISIVTIEITLISERLGKGEQLQLQRQCCKPLRKRVFAYSAKGALLDMASEDYHPHIKVMSPIDDLLVIENAQSPGRVRPRTREWGPRLGGLCLCGLVRGGIFPLQTIALSIMTARTWRSGQWADERRSGVWLGSLFPLCYCQYGKWRIRPVKNSKYVAHHNHVDIRHAWLLRCIGCHDNREQASGPREADG